MTVLATMNDSDATAMPQGAMPQGEATSLRRCIVTGVSSSPDKMIRFVVAPDGIVTPDLGRRLPGRGMWLNADRATVEQAVARKAFARAAKRAVTVPAELPALLERLVLQRALETLSLARRAGQAVSGLERVRQAQVGLMLLARDAGKDARNRVRGLAGGAPIVPAFDAAELGSAFGRDEAVFVALTKGRLAERMMIEAERLQGLRVAPTAPQDAN
jgi:predicted RNA-binding protein YlxR (DUF448 family)